jgi:hypothetical protein
MNSSNTGDGTPLEGRVEHPVEAQLYRPKLNESLLVLTRNNSEVINLLYDLDLLPEQLISQKEMTVSLFAAYCRLEGLLIAFKYLESKTATNTDWKSTLSLAGCVRDATAPVGWRNKRAEEAEAVLIAFNAAYKTGDPALVDVLHMAEAQLASLQSSSAEHHGQHRSVTKYAKASQWFKMGDHPNVVEAFRNGHNGIDLEPRQSCGQVPIFALVTAGDGYQLASGEVKPGQWIVQKEDTHNPRFGHYVMDDAEFKKTWESSSVPQDAAKRVIKLQAWDLVDELPMMAKTRFGKWVLLEDVKKALAAPPLNLEQPKGDV